MSNISGLNTMSPTLAPKMSRARLATRAGPVNCGMPTRTKVMPSSGSTLSLGPAISASEGLTSRETSKFSVAQASLRVH